MLGDRYFNMPVRKGLEWHSKAAATYSYIFNYTGRHSALESLGLNRKDWRNFNYFQKIVFIDFIYLYLTSYANILCVCTIRYWTHR